MSNDQIESCGRGIGRCGNVPAGADGERSAVHLTSHLTGEQERALELLLGGTSLSETAREVGVGRTTIYRWFNHDQDFRRIYNEWQEQMQRECHSRLVMLTEQAADALRKGLEAGDAKAALQLLKGMGLIRPVEPVLVEPMRQLASRSLERRKAWIEFKKGDFAAFMEEDGLGIVDEGGNYVEE